MIEAFFVIIVLVEHYSTRTRTLLKITFYCFCRRDEKPINIPTVLPTRTFLEKIFLLSEEFSKDNPRHIRMSRHLYDLEKLMDTEYGKDALKNIDLYSKIVNHRKNNYHLGYVDYSKHHPSTIAFTPPVDKMEKWNNDYRDMITNFIYEDKPKTFDELIKRMEELTGRLRDIEIDDNIIDNK